MDNTIILLDRMLKVLSHSKTSSVSESYPASIPLMKANYAGEVAAQGLYLGAWTFERDPQISYFYKNAMLDEFRHLDWCGERIYELGGTPSILNPVWFLGAYCMGAISQIPGQQYALGFVSETEKQVLKHLKSHLDRLPKKDIVSKKIIEQMIEEEAEHADEAKMLGGVSLSEPIVSIMKFCGKILTNLSERS